MLLCFTINFIIVYKYTGTTIYYSAALLLSNARNSLIQYYVLNLISSYHKNIRIQGKQYKFLILIFAKLIFLDIEILYNIIVIIINMIVIYS